jgi:hypothetical protein
MSTARWSLGRRVAFRFGVIAGALWIFPFPIDVIPKLDGVAQALSAPMDGAVDWFAQHVLGLAELAPASAFTGSGDRTRDYVQVLLIALLALVGTLVWSTLDRRRPAYPRLAAGAHVVLRYVVGFAMLSYGISKILRSQFSDILPGTLDQRIGDISPMRLVWTFMGYSAPYTVFAGLAEAIGGVLLLWWRTATIGALLIVVVMTNVVMFNLCYDVPVKIYSAELLVSAMLIAMPSARRLIAAAMGRATPDVPHRARMSRRWERAATIGKLLVIAAMAGNLYLEFSAPSRNDHVHELYGTWIVDTFVADGVERAPLTTDAVRWQRLSANPHGLWITVMTGARSFFNLEVDSTHQTLKLEPDKDRPTNDDKAATWTYTRPAPDRLVIDGVHRGHQVHAALHLEPSGLLLTRGFHWINERPFNR